MYKKEIDGAEFWQHDDRGQSNSEPYILGLMFVLVITVTILIANYFHLTIQ